MARHDSAADEGLPAVRADRVGVVDLAAAMRAAAPIRHQTDVDRARPSAM
jgi:hypothetical protein